MQDDSSLLLSFSKTIIQFYLHQNFSNTFDITKICFRVNSRQFFLFHILVEFLPFYHHFTSLLSIHIFVSLPLSLPLSLSLCFSLSLLLSLTLSLFLCRTLSPSHSLVLSLILSVFLSVSSLSLSLPNLSEG